jgi:hypothetical protein
LRHFLLLLQQFSGCNRQHGQQPTATASTAAPRPITAANVTDITHAAVVKPSNGTTR